MKNSERQKTLDEQKWLASEAKGCDQSGQMDWCGYCILKCFDGCIAIQAERECDNLCAKAYNRMVRSKAKTCLQRNGK